MSPPGGLNEAVTALFAALPDRGKNPAGSIARAALVNRLKGVTPGSHTDYLAETPQPFRATFFPSYAPDLNAASITLATGLDDSWWAAFNVVIICQAVYYVTSTIRSYIRQPDVNNQVVALNGTLASTHVNFLYARVVAAAPGTPVQSAFAQIAAPDREKAGQLYVNFLKNPAWISAKIGQFASGQWTNQVWELLHHWLKLYALGMTAAQIDAVIQALVIAQLPVPDAVNIGKWPACAPWLMPSLIDWNDIRAEATPGLLAGIKSVEQFADDFIADGGPGYQWATWGSGGSCFAAGAKVLMADGTLRPIEQTMPGDVVQSISGPRAVAAVASLRHQGDTLYGFTGTNMHFSATHPFLTFAGATGQADAAVAGVEPMRLMQIMPGLSTRGVTSFGSSCPPLAGYAGSVQPVRPGALQEYKVTPSSEMIYDLITDFDARGESHYFIGDDHTMFAVMSEAPHFTSAPAAAAAIMDIMAAAWPTIARAMQRVPPARWHRSLDRALRSVVFGLVPTVAKADPMSMSEAIPASWSAGPNLVQRAHNFASELMTGTSQTVTYDNARGACLAAVVAVFGDMVRDAVATGWRVFPNSNAADAPWHAVSALSFEVAGDAAPRSAGALTTELIIGGGTSATRHSLPAFASNGQPIFFRQIADVVHVPHLVAKPGAPIPLHVVFRDGSGNTLPLHGVTWLPDMTTQIYRRVSVPLFETGGTSLVVGQFQIDLRAADDASRTAETVARACWTSDAATKFAHALGQQFGTRLVAAFPDALIITT